MDTALVARHKELQKEVCDLTEAEEQLDQLISKCSLQLRLLTEDPQNKKYPFNGTKNSNNSNSAHLKLTHLSSHDVTQATLIHSYL